MNTVIEELFQVVEWRPGAAAGGREKTESCF